MDSLRTVWPKLNYSQKYISIKTEFKTKLFKIWSVTLYGCEALSKKKEDERLEEAAELWSYQIGIASQAKAYQMSWIQNRAPGIPTKDETEMSWDMQSVTK